MSKPKYKSLLLLHFNILIFSLTGIFSKCAANSVNQNGIFDFHTMLFGALMLLNCGIYAIFWQQTLKRFDVHVAYAHKAVYNIWSLLWAVLIFSEHITIGNIIGTVLIILGLVVMKDE